MPGLGLSLPEVAARIRGEAAVPPAAVTTVVIEGDSITSTTPNQSANRGDFYSYMWAAANAGLTVSVPAQASRTVGGAAYNGDGIDGPGGNGNTNTLVANRAADIAFGPQLLTVMVGANDLGSYQAATYAQRLIDWAGPVRAAGVKIAYSPPTPYRQTSPSANYINYTTRRTALFTTLNVRNPAVWGQWADYYLPMGEHPDFLDSSLDAATYGDEVHPSAPVSTATTGQARLYASYQAALTTLLDASRAGSTTVYNAVWPSSQTSLTTATEIVTRFIVAGLGHTGTALGIGTAGGGAQVRLNGGSYGTSIGTGSGNGWRIYNGDVIDFRITTPASNSTAVSTDLTIGSETRTLSFTTGAMVTPASYTHGDVVNATVNGTAYTFTGIPFGVTGTAVLAFHAGNVISTVSVGGVAATLRRRQYGDAELWMFTVPITAAGARNIAISFAGFTGQVTMSYGVMENADATPTGTDPAADGAASAGGQPYSSASLTVPASGLALAFFGEYAGGASVTPATANSGTTLIDEGQGSFNGEVLGIAVGSRATSGAASFNFGGYGPRTIVGIVFKAAGT